MDKVVKFLIFIVVITLIVAMANIFGLIPEDCIDPEKMRTLPAIAISSGVLIASITYISNNKNQLSDRQKESDEINLLIAKDGFDETYTLLKDLNNDRVTWIRAARILYKSLELKKDIKLPQFLKSFEVSEERLRNQLYRLLQTDPENPDQSDKVSLPPQFFYGIDNWRDCKMSLNEAAIDSKSPIIAYSVEIDKVLPEPKAGGLSESSVIAIYDFLEYPDDYSDPLSKIKPWPNNYNGIYGIEQGARRYISHKMTYSVIDKKIHSRE
ncbi:hypothetical protein [Sulfurimonas sp.]|uniref:hypothetical protein n=1 Tax=Sulfurimonas sp. TaxID=2022749 RepID=UPI002AB28DD5|nr:hypothetical protein [Sulfurimonas sp.]